METNMEAINKKETSNLTYKPFMSLVGAIIKGKVIKSPKDKESHEKTTK